MLSTYLFSSISPPFPPPPPPPPPPPSSKFMRTECLNSRYVFDMPLPLSRLVSAVGDSILPSPSLPSLHPSVFPFPPFLLPYPPLSLSSFFLRHFSHHCHNTSVWFPELFASEMQNNTQVYGRRPYGVGMLVAGFDVSWKICCLLVYTCTCVFIYLSVSLSLPPPSLPPSLPSYLSLSPLPPSLPPFFPSSLSPSLCLSILPQSQGPHLYQTSPSSNYYDCKAMAIGARSQSARTYLEKNLELFPNGR